MLKTLFLDRDGVINDVIMRDGVVSSPRALAEFSIKDEFIDFYNRLTSLSLQTFVVSNQPDVARRLLDRDELRLMTEELKRRFAFTEVIYCMHDNNDGCECRKPKPGMILQTLKQHDLKADESIIIGDSYKDILAGKAAGIRTIYYCQGYNSTVPCEPDYRVSKLIEALSLLPFTNLS
ncbi:MAG TPA: HAD-IIIA family hydrolase [Chroococcales cyanobacterium]